MVETGSVYFEEASHEEAYAEFTRQYEKQCTAFSEIFSTEDLVGLDNELGYHYSEMKRLEDSYPLFLERYQAGHKDLAA